MKLNQSPNDVATISGGGEVFEFSVNMDATLFTMLGSGLYKNVRRAIMRELSCNAVDSHIMAGKADVAYDVQLPSELSPQFRIRDYGTGLSHEQVKSLYTTYSSSSKRDSNDVIGALGLGSKSPLGYTNNFSVSSYYNGIKLMYAVFLNEQGVPSVVLQGQVPTDEPNGLEVIVPADNDYQEWKNELDYVYYGLTRVPVNFLSNVKLSNFEVQELHPGISLVSGLFVSHDQHGSIRKRAYYEEQSYNKLLLNQGGVLYDVDLQQLSAYAQKADPDNANKFRENIGIVMSMAAHRNRSAAVVMDFDIGDFAFTPNREEVKVNEKLINSIQVKSSGLSDSLREKYDWKKGQKLSEVMELRRAFYSDRSLTMLARHNEWNVTESNLAKLLNNGNDFLTIFSRCMDVAVKKKVSTVTVYAAQAFRTYYGQLPANAISYLAPWHVRGLIANIKDFVAESRIEFTKKYDNRGGDDVPQEDTVKLLQICWEALCEAAKRDGIVVDLSLDVVDVTIHDQIKSLPDFEAVRKHLEAEERKRLAAAKKRAEVAKSKASFKRSILSLGTGEVKSTSDGRTVIDNGHGSAPVTFESLKQDVVIFFDDCNTHEARSLMNALSTLDGLVTALQALWGGDSEFTAVVQTRREQGVAFDALVELNPELKWFKLSELAKKLCVTKDRAAWLIYDEAIWKTLAYNFGHQLCGKYNGRYLPFIAAARNTRNHRNELYRLLKFAQVDSAARIELQRATTWIESTRLGFVADIQTNGSDVHDPFEKMCEKKISGRFRAARGFRKKYVVS